MTAQAAVLPFWRRERPQPGLGRSFVLAFTVHAVLFGAMFLGVRWQSHDPETVTVELWEAPPPPPPPAPKVEPKPEPPPPAPPKIEAPKPEPKVEKPDIALREKPKPKPKPKPKAEPPKRDLEFERRLREQAAAEQQLLAEQQRIADAQRRERELKEMLARKEAAARASALAAWTGQIRAKIRGNIPVSVVEEVKGNPEAIFDVTLLPTGEVLSVVRRKSSGNRAYDEAVERAILKSSPLPKPDDMRLFQRRLELRFQPLDQ